MLRIVRRDEEVKINRGAAAGPDSVAQLHVRKDEADLGEAARPSMFQYLLVDVDAVVVGDTEGADARRRTFNGREEFFPRIAAAILVVQDGPRSVDVRVPSMPFRSGRIARSCRFTAHGATVSGLMISMPTPSPSLSVMSTQAFSCAIAAMIASRALRGGPSS